MNDKLETELRSAIRSQAESVHPADRLGAIRARTQGASAPAGTSWWNRPWVLAAGAGLVAASVVTAAVVLADPSADRPPVANGAEREVTVYEIGGVVGKETWLFPEQVTTEDTGDAAVDAVRALLEHEPTGDRDTLWEDSCALGKGVQSVEVNDEAVVVEFEEAAGYTCGLLARGGPAARQQQLAWTVRTATGSRLPVEISADGRFPVQPKPTWADPAALSPIIIESPSDGGTVSSPVTISGTSDTFEANVVWEVESEDTSFTEAGTTMGGSYGERAPFEFTVDLELGTYTARAYAEDMETGGLFAEDRVTFTVE